MKIIDLLNKIANDEENDLQTEFEFDGKIWSFYKLNHSKYCLDGWLLNQNITITKHKEILEEEKKIPEKIEREIYIDNGVEISSEPSIEQIVTKFNQLIDYLKSKGE